MDIVYILIGFLIALIGIPLLSTLAETIVNIGNLIEASLAAQIMKQNVKIAELREVMEKEEDEESLMKPIGFIKGDNKDD